MQRLFTFLYVSVFAGIVSLSVNGQGTNKFVSTEGDDGNAGTESSPYKTVTKALTASPDTIFLLPGTYYENVIIDNIVRNTANPLVIIPKEKGTVLFEGVERFTYNWQPYSENNNIFVSDLPKDVWQLFIEGKMMINARWPNADHPFEDFDKSNWWDRHETWCKAKQSGTRYLNVQDNGEKGFATTGIDFSGKIGVLNVNSMESYSGFIRNHAPGLDSFDYELHPDVVNSLNTKQIGVINKNAGHAYYFFENGLDLLDVPGEWYYDKTEKKVYVYPEAGIDLTQVEVKGKTQSYAFEVTNSEFVYITGINFFGTTISYEQCFESKIEDCNFIYASYSKRMLDDISEIDHTKMVILTKPDKNNLENNRTSNNQFVNNEVAFTDGMAFHMTRGFYDTIYNNYFHHIDISGTRGGSIGVDYRGGYYTAFIRNTFEKGGGSAATKSANFPYNALNRLSQWGYIQDDGVAFQIANGGQIGSISTQNWIYNSPKAGLRFDGGEDTDPLIENKMIEGTFVRNVVWDNPLGYMVKGDYHRVYNNIAFNNSATGAKILDSEFHDNANTHSITRNNVMEDMTSNRSGNQFSHPVVGTVDHNWLANPLENNISKVLRDPYNLDFRPKEGSELVDRGIDIPAETFPITGTQIPDFTSEFKVGDSVDMGAYEFNYENYWIPGRMQPKASTPIPPNGTQTAMVDADLMWLPAYKSFNNKVYFGETETSLELVSEQANNIYDPGDLDPSKQYYWRVDCETANGWVTGEVWSFIPNGQPYKDCGMRSSSSLEFSTPNGMEDYNSIPFENPKNFLGEVHLLSDQLVIMTDSDSMTWNNNGLEAVVNVKIRDYPFVSFDYYTPDRETAFPIGIQVKTADKKSKRNAAKTTLEPAQNEQTNVILSLQRQINSWDDAFGSDTDWPFMERFIFIHAPEGDWIYANDGDFWMDNLEFGFAAIKDKIANPVIIGQKEEITISESTSLPITLDDLDVVVTYNETEYTFPLCETTPDNWSFLILEGENYSFNNTVIIPDEGFVGELSIPVMLTTGDYESPHFNVMVTVEADTSNSGSSKVDAEPVQSQHFIFPNPASNKIYIKNNAEIEKIEVFNSRGNLMEIHEYPGLSLDISMLPKGLYLIKFTLLSGETKHEKLLVM